MYQIKLSQAELSKLKKKIKQEKNTRFYYRLRTVYLANRGKKNKEIAAILKVNKNSITKWMKVYQEGGLKGLCQPIDYDRRSAKIDSYIDKIKQDVKENTISTLAELQSLIKKKYSLEIELSWLWRCCKKNSICLVKKRA